MTAEKQKNTRCKFKTWGKFKEQTVKKHASHRSVVIRQGEKYITVRNDEVESLIVAMLEIRSCK